MRLGRSDHRALWPVCSSSPRIPEKPRRQRQTRTPPHNPALDSLAVQPVAGRRRHHFDDDPEATAIYPNIPPPALKAARRHRLSKSKRTRRSSRQTWKAKTSTFALEGRRQLTGLADRADTKRVPAMAPRTPRQWAIFALSRPQLAALPPSPEMPSIAKGQPRVPRCPEKDHRNRLLLEWRHRCLPG